MDKIDNSAELNTTEDSKMANDELARRRAALLKMAKIAAVAPPAVLGVLYSKRALAASGEI